MLKHATRPNSVTYPTIAICSLFRNSSHIIPSMIENRGQWDYPREQLYHICVEGDSEDDTWDLLHTAAKHNPHWDSQ
jgi:hypothetical protein